MIPILDPPGNWSLPYEMQHNPFARTIGQQHADDITQPGQLAYRRTVKLYRRAADQPFRDYILSFIHGLAGKDGPIQWSPIDYCPSPVGVPFELTSETAGNRSARNIRFKVTWSQGPGETLPSPELTLDSGTFINGQELITIKVPPFPPGVEGWNVYARQGGDTLFRKQAKVLRSRQWTEVEEDADFDSAGDTPPTENTLKPPAKWRIKDYKEVRTKGFFRWDITLDLEEILS